MKYVYFVSHYYSTGRGRMVLDRDSLIDTVEDIEEIEKHIASNNDFGPVCVTNFKLLRTEDEK